MWQAVSFPKPGNVGRCAKLLRDIWVQSSGQTCILGIDANGRVPLNFANATGDLYEDEADDTDTVNRITTVAAAQGVWIPSTFDMSEWTGEDMDASLWLS